MSVIIRSSFVLIFLAGSWGYADETLPDNSAPTGVWEVVEATECGLTASPEECRKLHVTFTFTKDRMFMTRAGIRENLEFTFTADSTRNPGWLDLIPSDGPFKGKKHLSVYEYRKNDLKLCIPKRPVEERPAKVESPRGSILNLYVLKRLSQ
tara:strand:+ start:112 stop:567 length:456 start_codon:yes stop_codon:yes gene_type:complete